MTEYIINTLVFLLFLIFQFNLAAILKNGI